MTENRGKTDNSANPEEMEIRTFKLTLSTFSNISNSYIPTGANETDALQSEGPYQAVEVVIIVLLTGSISFVTITGNILIMLAIIINRNLQTMNSYFLFSLACADLIVGVSVMNLSTVYIMLGYWPLGPVVCDLWLLLDYVVSTASVMNLLIISFDRYFCVTKPLSYPAWRTTKIAGLMIAAAWVISFIIWAPPVLFWPFIVGERIVPVDQCSIQFLYDVSVTFISSTAFFFLPVAIMTFLYWRISRASKSRVKTGKQVPKQDNPSSGKAGKRTTMPCDDDYVKTHFPEKSWSGGTGGVGEEESSAPVHPERNEIAETPAGPEGNPTAHSLNATMLKQRPERKAPPPREKKVTRMIMMILVAFIVTWAPYQVMKVISTFCSTCVPSSMSIFGFWLTYVNSSINPACYALCHVTFKKTFKQLLLCQYKDIRLGK